MVLLNHVVHIPTRPSLTFVWHELLFLQISNRTDIATVLIDIDDARWGDIWSAQDFAEKAFGCSSAAGLIQEKIECLTG